MKKLDAAVLTLATVVVGALTLPVVAGAQGANDPIKPVLPKARYDSRGECQQALAERRSDWRYANDEVTCVENEDGTWSARRILRGNN
jgi:hypothetical protein